MQMNRFTRKKGGGRNGGGGNFKFAYSYALDFLITFLCSIVYFYKMLVNLIKVNFNGVENNTPVFHTHCLEKVI